ncbi:S8 family peptidase [Clostridium sp.]|uniref:S8 family peptidase n=1 Tax=Clostridium sp. TaxID=1506 RepID=UPI002FC6ABA1
MNYGGIESSSYKNREQGPKSIYNLTQEEFNKYYLSGNYEVYFIEYFGDIVSALAPIEYADVFITEKFFAILFVQRGMLATLNERVPEIAGIQRNFIYTLSELTVNNEATSLGSVYEGNIPLDGEGVVVGIIGTGIDYMNPRFITETGESRIVAIWDQTIARESVNGEIPYGTEYSRAIINEAIRAGSQGTSPYEIVAHRDEVGHGTAIAGLVGGRSLDELLKLKSVAPKCEFAIVKLEEARDYNLEAVGIAPGTKNVYQAVTIALAIKYLSDLQLRLKRPMVVCLPMGSNFGSRDGGAIMERYIDSLTRRKDFCIVTDTGDQGRGLTHASGTIESAGSTEDIFINVGAEQSTLAVSVYIKRPDNVTFSITSPLGGTISEIPLPSINEQSKYLNLEENGINIEYSAQETVSKVVRITMIIKNTFQGVWKISILGEYIVSGLYDAWLLNSQLLRGDTRFLNPDPYTTLLTPSTSNNIIVTSSYNQITNTIREVSGKGFPRDGVIKPSFATAGTNFLTVGLNNSLVVGSGCAMSSAIVAGTLALIYQWGIVQKRNTQLYPPNLKNFLIAATEKDDDKIYPNEEWGYGKLSINKLYEILLAVGNKVSSNNTTNESINNNNTTTAAIRVPVSCTGDESNNYLFISIPFEIYKRINK